MKQTLRNFILEFKHSDPDLVNIILEGMNVLLEEPHIFAPRSAMVKNEFSVNDLLELEKKKRKTIHVTNVEDFDSFDLYVEQTGMTRADGVIHEPLKYIRDISLGKAVISPRDNISIKLSKADGANFLNWISQNKSAMLSIRGYLQENPDKAMELPYTFYDNAVKNKTMPAKEVMELLPSPRGIHESK